MNLSSLELPLFNTANKIGLRLKSYYLIFMFINVGLFTFTCLLQKMLPFAIVGSTEETKVNGRTLRVRQYPWGCVQVENEAHCDFVRLREMLLRVNMEDLRERTHTVHYETYRKQRLTEMGFRDDEDISLQVAIPPILFVSKS